jgi:hypothetical protein
MLMKIRTLYIAVTQRWAPAVQNFRSRRTRKNKIFSVERGCVMRIQKWALFARWQVFNFAQLAPQLTTAVVHTEEQRTSAIADWLPVCFVWLEALFEEAKLIAHKL